MHLGGYANALNIPIDHHLLDNNRTFAFPRGERHLTGYAWIVTCNHPFLAPMTQPTSHLFSLHNFTTSLSWRSHIM